MPTEVTITPEPHNYMEWVLRFDRNTLNDEGLDEAAKMRMLVYAFPTATGRAIHAVVNNLITVDEFLSGGE